MADTVFSDEWLVRSLEGLLTPERLAELRGQVGASSTLWEAMVKERWRPTQQILAALAARFRIKIANSGPG